MQAVFGRQHGETARHIIHLQIDLLLWAWVDNRSTIFSTMASTETGVIGTCRPFHFARRQIEQIVDQHLQRIRPIGQAPQNIALHVVQAARQIARDGA